MSFPNVYAHRKVAETAKKCCDICYKLTSSVLYAEGPEGKDFFYICPAHLKDRNFATPHTEILAAAVAAAETKRQEAIARDIAEVKKKFLERQKKLKEEEEAKIKKKSQDGDDDSKPDDDSGARENKEEKDKDGTTDTDDKNNVEEIDMIPKKPVAPLPEGMEPRVFVLHKTFYQRRQTRHQQAAMERRRQELSRLNAERSQNDNFWPTTPRNLP